MEAYIGQIEAFAFNFAPTGWAMCAGQLLSIAQNSALFAILGTTYGGNGVQTFALPDLRGRISLGVGTGPGLPPATLGERSGEETHTLLWTEVPPHSHNVNAVNNGIIGGSNTPGPSVTLGSSRISGSGAVANLYSATTPSAPMTNVNFVGGQPHENRMPYLAMNYCIALVGLYPSRS